MDSSQGPYEGEYDNSGPEKALDNDLSTSTHTDNNFVVKHWWKVQFDRRVFVDKVRVVNRQICCQGRANNADIITSVAIGNRFIETVCANLGILGVEKTLKCQQTADELKIVQPAGEAVMHLGEVYIYGNLCNDV